MTSLLITKITDILSPVNTQHSTHAGVMLGHRRRRWPNINPAWAVNAAPDSWGYLADWKTANLEFPLIFTVSKLLTRTSPDSTTLPLILVDVSWFYYHVCV